MMLITVASFSQVPSNITDFLNQECGFTSCASITLGCCGDDTDHPDQDPTLCVHQEYYVTEDVIFNSEALTLAQCTLTFKNGANFVNNGFPITLLCGANIVFEGGGQEFGSVEEMNATLGIKTEVDLQHLPLDVKYNIIDMTGRIIDNGVTNDNTLTEIKQYKGFNVFQLEGNYKAIKIVN